jgi:CubicO group peptidase (beta-lactamase class C family)
MVHDQDGQDAMYELLRDILSRRLQPAMDQKERNGIFSGTVLVSHRTDILMAGAWGYACRTWKIKNALDTLFPTASVTKIFTATALLQLVEAGRLCLHQPVRALLPLGNSAIPHAVTVYHLLTHTSGIGDYFSEDEEAWPRIFLTTPTYCIRSVADFLPLFTALPPRFPAGTRFDYCNAGYILLGRIIEVLTDNDYFEVIRQQIFVPADMERACFPTVDTVCEQLADAYTVSLDATGTQRWTKCVSTSLPPAPDGGLAASAPELERYWHALLGGRLLRSDSLQAMLTPQVSLRAGRAYGLGVYLICEPPGLPRYEAHGFDAGTNAYMAHYPTLDVNVIVLSNLDQAAMDVFHQVHACLIEHARLEGLVS